MLLRLVQCPLCVWRAREDVTPADHATRVRLDHALRRAFVAHVIQAHGDLLDEAVVTDHSEDS